MKLSLEDRERLIHEATLARTRAYAPYSRYQVGAAILTEDGQLFSGGNVENAVYPLGLCAERVAIAAAVAAGVRRVIALAVITANGGTPCGACRQVLREFAEVDTPVLIGTPDGAYHEMRLEDLLPESFSVADLSQD
ncbi:MAG: Cytidine deaminase [Chloroflexi bacterium ADurb.Bin360]|nr:MAG: Cytidine deaminase [Chloroflexi bacterium ADurb.Bin360]